MGSGISIFAIFLLVRGGGSQTVQGIDISKLPQCAQTCLESNTGAAAPCSITDLKCICGSINYINALSCCLHSQCNAQDQQAALAFDIELCNRYNVTIPNFIGCSPFTSSGVAYQSNGALFSANASLQGSTLAGAAISTTTATSTSFVSLPVMSTNGPTASFVGHPLLTGNCTSPAVASASAPDGGSFEFPLIGCHNAAASCCPFPMSSAGPLTVCPQDYSTTSGICCPSGWSLFPTILASQTVCYTPSSGSLIATGSARPGVTIVNEKGFTAGFALVASTTLPDAAKIGIGVGIPLAVILGAMFLWWRRRCFASIGGCCSCFSGFLRRPSIIRSGRNRDATAGPYTLPTVADNNSNNNNHHTEQLSTASPLQLHPQSIHLSPLSAQGSQNAHELPSPPATSPMLKIFSNHAPLPQPAMELPGSTYIHEHHPAYSSPTRSVGDSTLVGGGPGGSPRTQSSPQSPYRPPYASVERLPSPTGREKS